MKRIALLTCFLLSFSFLFAQYPATQTLGSDSTLIKSKGALQGRLINWSYPDTASANRERISQIPHAQIVVGNDIYLRDRTATRWILQSGAGVQGSILNDSTFLLCNSNGCDTFRVHNISITSFSFTSDSTVKVCNSAGACDTISFSPVPLNKFYVDSTKILSGGSVDTLVYYINGVSYIGGFVNHLAPPVDGIITPGYVTWTGSGLTYNISGADYIKNGIEYRTRDTTITLDPADPTYGRIDKFAVDTLSRTIKITGTPSPSPIEPQVDQFSQLALTTGITLNAGDTVPSVTIKSVYNENLGTPTEWTTGSTGTISVDFSNTISPYKGTKDADVVSYSKNAQLTFTGATQAVSGQMLSAWVYLKAPLGNKNSLSFQFYNGSTAVSNAVQVRSTYGLNPNLVNTYQQITLPVNSFTWSSQSFNKLVITMTNGATTGFKLDYIQLQSGLQNIPQTDYSNKVDSTTISNGYEFWWSKGIAHVAGQVVSITDTALIKSLISDSIIGKLNISDTSLLNHYSNTYVKYQTDSIAAQLRSEITAAAGGGVISFNGRNGAVTSDSTDYNFFFYTKHLTDSLLALKSTFSGNYNDLTNKPVTVTNLSLGTVTSTSQVINNSNGTGVTLPSASISTAGLMTAGDKVLVNTISSKLAIADTASMLAPYLRKSDAFTKTQADLLYRPITYVPSWSEITGKPTIPAAQIQSDWNQTNNTLLDYIKNKPTIPTNNNQLTNGAGYITGIDSANYLHKSDSSLYVTPTQLSLSHTDSTAYHTLAINSDTTGATLNRPNGTSDFIPLPFVKKTDTSVIKVHYPIWAFTSDSLGLRTDSMPKLEYAIAGRDTSTWDNQTLIDKQFLQDRISTVTATGITRTELQDTAAAIRSSMGSGSVLSVTGNPSALVDNTDPANPIIQQDASKLDKSDSTIANRVTANTTNIAANTTAIAGKLSNITGLVTQGTNVTVTGSGTSGSPYVINSSGGSSTIDQTLTATAGQTSFVFTSVPTRFLITINGTVYNNYTVSGSTVTVGMTDILAGDKIRLYQTQ